MAEFKGPSSRNEKTAERNVTSSAERSTASKSTLVNVLQRTIGNQAVMRSLKRAGSEGPKADTTNAEHDSSNVTVYPPGTDPIYGPFILPEVVITATKSIKSSSGQQIQIPARDVTFVAVQTAQDISQRMVTLNEQADESLRENDLARQGTISDPEAEARAQEETAQKLLKDQFGDFWGTVFWWTRGGGQTGEDSPLWKVLNAAGSLNRAYPTPRYPTAPRVYPSQLPTVNPTESTK